MYVTHNGKTQLGPAERFLAADFFPQREKELESNK